jgi:nucleotide-binding universal stress UspA family protein
VAPSAQSFVGGVTPWSDDMAEIDDQLREQAADWLDDLAGEVGGEGVVLQGSHPGEIAVVWAEEQGVDLLVVAPHRGRLARIALGSVASYVATNATCAVLIARGDAIEEAARAAEAAPGD